MGGLIRLYNLAGAAVPFEPTQDAKEIFDRAQQGEALALADRTNF